MDPTYDGEPALLLAAGVLRDPAWATALLPEVVTNWADAVSRQVQDSLQGPVHAPSRP